VLPGERKNFGPLLHTIQERLQASRPPFGKWDRAAIFLLSEYKQRTLREAVVTREVKRWSDQIDVDIRDAMSDFDWEMFRSSSSDVSEFTDMVMSFIATLVDTIIPMRSFPNQKPWVDGSIRATLNARTAAYNSSLVSGHMDKYKAASYRLRRVVKDTKRWYRDRVESQTPMAGATDYHGLLGQNPFNC